MHDANRPIVDALSHIAEVYRSQGTTFKYKAYRTAIDTIKGVETAITSSAQLKGMKGIGKAMLEKIDELLNTGKLQQEADVMADPVNAALKLFTSIHGIGPVLAKSLVDQGHRTLEDLETVHLPAAARMGLKYRTESAQRIPFDEVEAHLAYLQQLLHREVDAQLTVFVCGSHRRLGATSGDCDFLMTHPGSHSQSGAKYLYLARAMEAMKKAGYVVDVLAEGTTKCMAYARLPSSTGDGAAVTRRVDVRWVPFDHFPCALLYFTGSDMFNVNMRTDALKLGYTLNEYRVARVDGADASLPPVPLMTCELDVFRLLGREYVAPVKRSK